MTKDEFISKYHTQKVLILRFEPPTWEEFLEIQTKSMVAHWFDNNSDISIVMWQENDKWGINDTNNEFIIELQEEEYCESVKFEYNEFIDNREEMYYKALDIAKKWFLGEKYDK